MCLLLLLCAFQGSGEFYALYESGLAKLEEKNFAEAAQDLEQAIALRPQSSETARPYGVRLVPYFPYHNLAYAYFGLQDLEKAENYLKLAYENEEDQAKDPLVGVRISMIETMLEIYADRVESETPDVMEPPKPEPELEGILSLLLSNQPDEALAEVDKQIFLFPDDESLPMMRDLTTAMMETQREQDALTKRQILFAESLNDLARQAGESEQNGLLDRALQFNIAILQLDPENVQASQSVERLREKIEQRGQIEERSQEAIEEARQIIARLEDEKADLERQSDRLSNQNADFLKRIDDYQKSRLVPPPRIEVTWNVVPLGIDRQAHVSAEIKANLPLKFARLKVNEENLEQWDLQGSEFFRTPLFSNLSFEKYSNDLTIVVEDMEGNPHSEKYPLTFPPPRPLIDATTRQVLIWLGVVVVTGLFAMRTMRRRRAMRERFNPYIAGAPVLNERMFYGRNQLLKQILNTLHNNSLMIYGERRIGKTSFLHRLNTILQDLDDPEYVFIPVFIDLQGVKENDFFQVLDLEIGSAVETRGVKIEHEESVNARIFISRLRRTIKLLKDLLEKKPKLVLLLDEVDVMNGFSENTNQQLRSVFMKGFADHIVAVMAGIHINKKWKSEGSPWYNFFEQIELKEFSKKHADALITRPVEGVYFYTKEAVDKIMEITDGKPYLIQKMCLNLVAHILGRNQRKITAEDVSEVFKEIEREFYGAS